MRFVEFGRWPVFLRPRFLAVVQLEVVGDAEFFEQPEDALGLGVLRESMLTGYWIRGEKRLELVKIGRGFAEKRTFMWWRVGLPLDSAMAGRVNLRVGDVKKDLNV
jgi:hypothetical protein